MGAAPDGIDEPNELRRPTRYAGTDGSAYAGVERAPEAIDSLPMPIVVRSIGAPPLVALAPGASGPV